MRKIISPEELPSIGCPLYSPTHRQRLEDAGQFPKRVRLSERRYGYVVAEIEAWLQERISARDSLAKAG